MRTCKPIHYLQYDSRWGSIMFSNHGDPKQTIASSGCGATSFAMVLATFLDSVHTPVDVAAVIVANRYRTYDNGVDWGWFPFAAKHYDLPFKQTSSTDGVIQALKNSALVVASMGPGYFTRYGHYILLWGLDEANKQILANDPNSTVRTKASYDLFRQQAAQYFIFYAPKGGNDVSGNQEMNPVTIKAGDKEIKAVEIGGRVIAPVRALAEALGHEVTWDEAKQRIVIK